MVTIKLLSSIEHPESSICNDRSTHVFIILFGIQPASKVRYVQKLNLLDDILQETEELIKIFVKSIKAAKKKQK